MLLNYFKLSMRLLLRNPFLTVINLAGLSVGIATFLLLWPAAEFELKTDRYHVDSERIVRLGVNYRWTDDNQNWNGFFGAFNWIAVNYELQETLTQVESNTWVIPQLYFSERLNGFAENIFITVLSGSDKKASFRETHAAIGAENLLQFFTIPLIEGDPKTALSNPNAIALSESTAKKYFGDGPWLNKTVYLNDTILLNVTCVFKDLPHNTHLDFNMILSSAKYENISIKEYNGWYASNYLKLKPGVTVEAFSLELERRQQQLYAFTKLGCSHCDITPRPQELTDVAFTNWRGNAFKYKSRFLLEALAAVSFVVLGFAWINYINLSINSLNKRLNEIGTRKSIGAKENDFFLQFFVESFVMNVISFGIALTLVQFIGKIAEDWFQFYIPAWDEISLSTTAITMVTLGIGVFIATLFPLLLITRRRPNELFKKFKGHIKASKVSTTLVTLQYCIATVLLVWISAVYFQLDFILNLDTGVQKEGLVVIDSPLKQDETIRSKIPSFLNEIKRIEGVYQTTSSHSTIGEQEVGGLDVQLSTSSMWYGADTNGGVDEAFLDTYDIPLLAGRNFRADNPSDRSNVLISKALAKRLGFESIEQVIGKQIIITSANLSAKAEIIGVFQDYEFRPFFSDLTEKDRGVILTYKDFLIPYFKPWKLTVQIDPQKLEAITTSIERLYNETFQESFKWNFLDEKLKSRYANEQSTKNQLALFSILAVGITCLGLLGMISNKVVEKTKEIGIRKVFGARMHQIAQVLLNTTARHIVVANIVGIPLAYFFVERYLEKFSVRIHLTFWHFTIPVIILILIMFATVAVVLIRAAKNNPVEALRHE